MCIVIDLDGTEHVVPDKVYLDSNNIRRTVKFLEAEKKIWMADWKRKKEERKKNNSFKRKLIRLFIN